MALTLTQGEEYSTTEMQRAVIDKLVKDSPILQRLGFVTILGNSLTYDTITTDATANFYSVGSTWTEDTGDVTQATANLTILGGDADIDNFLLKTRSNKIDLKGTVIGNKVKAVQYAYLDKFYYGVNADDSKQFNGMHTLIADTTYNSVAEGTSETVGVITVTNLRAAKDLITGFTPDLMVMSKMARRSISTYLDSVGANFQRMEDKFGKHVQAFDDCPIAVDDHILNTEDISTGGVWQAGTGDGTTIFFLTFDDMACAGLHSGDGVQVEPLGSLETKDASRWRIKWYCSLMFQNIRSCAKLSGCDPDGTTTA